ncbi:MAG: HAD family phosphatase [Anaerolineae bacterium]
MRDIAYAAVLFDMDGLMFDTERLILRAWQRAMADFGYAGSEEVFLASVGTTVESTNRLLRAAYGPDFALEATNERTGEYIWQEVDAHGPPLKPGLLALLDYLEAIGIPKAVASSSERATIDRLLAAAGLAQRFAASAAGDEVARGKPAPDIFLLAAQRLGVEPARCLVLEDSNPGAQAAHAAGMAVIVVPDLTPPSAEAAALAAAILPDLHAVQTWLAQRDAS